MPSQQQPATSPQLPYNVLSVIASKADRPTQARMRVMDRRTYADPLMRVRNPPKGQGYLYGTGKLQKLYNDMPRRLRVLVAKAEHLEGRWLSRSPQPLLMAASRLKYDFMDMRNMYMEAVKQRPVSGWRWEWHFMQMASPGAAPPQEPEAYMTATLKLADAKVRKIEQGLRGVPNAAVQSILRRHRQAAKQEMTSVWEPEAEPGELEAIRARRRARRLAARAARRLRAA